MDGSNRGKAMRKLVVTVAFAALMACDTGMTVGEAEDQVRAILRDPTSAEFTNVIRHPPMNGKGAVVCGYVNAKNGFGGMTGPVRFLAGSTTLIDNDPSETGQQVFEGVWGGLCN
jgi:hypothetical protein